MLNKTIDLEEMRLTMQVNQKYDELMSSQDRVRELIGEIMDLMQELKEVWPPPLNRIEVNLKQGEEE